MSSADVTNDSFPLDRVDCPMRLLPRMHRIDVRDGILELSESTGPRKTLFAMGLAGSAIVPAIVAGILIILIENESGWESNQKTAATAAVLIIAFLIFLIVAISTVYQYRKHIRPRELVVLRYNTQTRELAAPFARGHERRLIDDLSEMQLRVARFSSRDGPAHTSGTVCHLVAIERSGGIEIPYYSCYYEFWSARGKVLCLEQALREFSKHSAVKFRVQRWQRRYKIDWSTFKHVVSDLR